MSSLPMTDDALLQSCDSRGVLTLTLNRPEIHNAFGDTLIASLAAVLDSANDDSGIRVIVITGAGKSFSAGADLNWMRGMLAASAEENERDALQLAAMLRCLNYNSKPTIARVNGSAFGGGVGLIACCDIVVGADAAQFGLTEVHLGLVPAIISPYVFRRIGERNARRYFLNAERFDAGRALEIGLLQEVVPMSALDQQVDRQVEMLLRAGPVAAAQSKSLLFRVAGLDVTRQLHLDQENARLIARLRVSAEGQEGLAAFLEKRHPDWVQKETQQKHD
jgi:methylglutaconyl-CoA hydratase